MRVSGRQSDVAVAAVSERFRISLPFETVGVHGLVVGERSTDLRINEWGELNIDPIIMFSV